MEYINFLVMFFLGLVGGGLSGMLGIGGGIIMVPLLLFIPPMFGFTEISMRLVAGMTTVQSFAGAVSGAFKHKSYDNINLKLAFSMGIPMALSSYIGSMFSTDVSEELMLQIFGAMAILAVFLMMLPKKTNEEQSSDELQFSIIGAIIIGIAIGICAGLIGQGGGFIFIPAMLFLLSIPTRITIGTALVIGIISSAGVLAGRLGTGQIPWGDTIPMVIGVLIGAQLGAYISQRLKTKTLKVILSALILLSATKIWVDILFQPL